MKKITILTSALVLAACGGGGSGLAGGGYVPPRPAVSSAIATSNAEITAMPSEVGVASNSSTPVSVVGAVSTEIGGVTYTSYRLDDVKLFTAENLDTTGHSYVNLELNEETGEIDAVKMVIGGEDSGRNVRDGNIFQGPVFEYVPDGDDDRADFRVVDNGQNMAALNALATQNNLSGGHWNRVDERMVFTTHGNGMALQYSDFGYFNPVYRTKNKNLTTDDQIAQARAGTLDRSATDPNLDKKRTDEQFNEALAKEDYQLFAGGYAISGTTMVDTLTPENDTSYTGKAVGRIYVSIQGSGAGRAGKLEGWVPFDKDSDTDGIPDSYVNADAVGHDMAKAYTTSEATMTIGADGSQTLSMPFNSHSDTADTFYDVTVTQATPSSNPVFAFTGTSDMQYKVNNAPVPAKTESSLTAGYYGVNTPVEAAGTARYATEQDLGDGFRREWEFQAAYGMKKN